MDNTKQEQAARGPGDRPLEGPVAVIGYFAGMIALSAAVFWLALDERRRKAAR
jgi:hypothetical protein